MNKISTSDIKKLRDLTGAGFLDCKEALENCGLDIDKAIEFLRKKGKLFLEIVFVDDGSTDISKKKILNFINKNKKLWDKKNKENRKNFFFFKISIRKRSI